MDEDDYDENVLYIGAPKVNTYPKLLVIHEIFLHAARLAIVGGRTD